MSQEQTDEAINPIQTNDSPEFIPSDKTVEFAVPNDFYTRRLLLVHFNRVMDKLNKQSKFMREMQHPSQDYYTSAYLTVSSIVQGIKEAEEREASEYEAFQDANGQNNSAHHAAMFGGDTDEPEE